MKITIIGCGNVGYHLAQRLYSQGHEIIEVFSRTASKAAGLAALVEAKVCEDLDALDQGATVYILAVSDAAIGEVASRLAYLDESHKIVAHTSGATPLDVLVPHFKNAGVFYPLQTFSRDRVVDFERLPMCIMGLTASTKMILTDLAETICPNVYPINDEQRQWLHVGAVFVNNFTNSLYLIAYDICDKQQLPFDILKPLLYETAMKIKALTPLAAQTGPARRGDKMTIDRHLNLLKDFPNYQQLYNLLTSQLIEQFKEGKG